MTTHRSGSARHDRRREGQPLIGVPQAPAGRELSPAAETALKLLKGLVVYAITPVVILALLAATLGYVWLRHGDVPLNAFSKQIERRINAALVGFRADIDDAFLTIGDDKGVELRIANLRIREADGDEVVSAPEAAVTFDASALWRLDAVPELIELIKPKLAVDYNEEQGLSLSIANEAGGAAGGGSSARPMAPRASASPHAPAFHRIDVAKLLADASARARKRGGDEARLTKFGVQDATVLVTDSGETSEIRIKRAAFNLDHTSRDSVVSGTLDIDSGGPPWTLDFRMEEAPGGGLAVKARVDKLVPSALAKVSPRLALFEIVAAPMTGELRIDLDGTGDLVATHLTAGIDQGSIRLPSLASTPLVVDSGTLDVRYLKATREVTLAPSTLTWAGSRITLEGLVSRSAGSDDPAQWHFDLRAKEGALSAEEFHVAPIPIEGFQAEGRIIPAEGLLQLSAFRLKAGGGEITANGEVINGPGAPSTRLEAALSPMPLATLKAMWPRAAAAAARAWVGEHVSQATLQSASLKVLSGRFLESGSGLDPAGSRERISAIIEISDLHMTPLPRSLPIEAPQAVIRMENSTLELSVPKATIVASPEHRLPLNGVRLTIVDVRHDVPIAELALKSTTTLPVLVETLNRSQLHLAGHGPLPIEGIDGKVDGEIKIAMPLVDDASVVKATGKARITDIKGKSKAYHVDLQGGTIDVDASEIGVIAKGDLMVNGVLAKLHMHRLLDAAPEAQPPIKIMMSLDNSDRNQLGLDVNHFVQGTMPVEVTVNPRADGPPRVHVRADLSGAELLFQAVAWTKPRGLPASLDFDLASTDEGHVRLENFKLVGDNIAIDGSAVFDDKREVREFSFPNFSINVVSRLDVRGKLDSKRIWSITAKGSTFDAKDLFRSMLAFSDKEAAIKARHPAAGVDFKAEIDTIIGNSETSLRKAKIKYSERGDKIVSIEADGTLEGDHPVMLELRPDRRRVVYAKSSDAGQTLKMIGLYPNLKGGRMELEVALDGEGAADMQGRLLIDDFRVLGDPIVSEVYSSAEGGQSGAAARKPKPAAERQVFEFQRMTVPFSVGHGQFVLDDSYVRGPLLGASMRGRVDFNARRVNLGGTYVPLQGINAAVCDIPLFGPIVAGFDCQGVFGITYAIQGSMDGKGPDVLVNPLSMFTPGILRGIMELTGPNPQVQPKRSPAPGRARAAPGSDGKGPAISDGWSSETTTSGGRKRN